ncbi:ABC transporter substrate-binding protein [Comamonas koreensis]|uniref:ABC transporter substrate-binding protein n=2 Tax=Comamonas koreensis TaxID=160825 RepID=A0AAW4Y2S1_9BURK|nr:ABC transporter substrate-binding protein [Comamonas koreensis]MCD2167730.1 ABC transporter substrate-binding protein [Comamonas koreensis]
MTALKLSPALQAAGTSLVRMPALFRTAAQAGMRLRALGVALGLGLATGLTMAAPAQAAAEAPAAQGSTVVDIVGRTVQIPAQVEHILLGEGRFLYALALMEGAEPLKRIVGWQGELAFADPNGWAAYQQRFPQITQIPLIGRTSEDSVSYEKSVSTQPDIAIFGLGGHGPGRQSSLVQALEKSGVPVVFIDFRAQPVRNTAKSIRILGQAVHREAQANAYADFYETHLQRVQSRVKDIPAQQRPLVFAELLAGVWDGCCHTAGKGNVGEFIDAAGGINIAAGKIPGAIGDLNQEALIAQDPAIYIATGSRPQGSRPMVRAGEGVSAAQLGSSLRELAQRPGFEMLSAVRSGRAHGLWHNFYDAPTNILAIEAMAKWFYPERFADVDPQATMAEINQRFLQALPMQGAYWGDIAPLKAKP